MIYEKILNKYKLGKKQFSVLIDPEKSDEEHLSVLLKGVNTTPVDFILLGGSTGEKSADDVLATIRKQTSKPVVLFPGDVSHLTKGVDAVLFLSLLSGRNPDFLIENHVKAAPLLKGMEVIPVSYILIDGGRKSATERVSETVPMSSSDIEAIVNTALAGELLGHKITYLEAGSGAETPVHTSIIRQVRAATTIPLFIGGGLKSKQDVDQAYKAGADVVVVGNALEDNPHLLSQLLA